MLISALVHVCVGGGVGIATTLQYESPLPCDLV